MFKPFQRQAWTCARCLRQQARWEQRRAQSTAAAAVMPNYENGPAAHFDNNTSYDDSALRNIFDSKQYWQNFKGERHGLDKRTGLVGNRYLTTPSGFSVFAKNAVEKCRSIVDRTLAAKTVEQYKSLAKNLDRLSDLLCRVIDLSDFMRSTHPDHRFAQAADHAYSMMFEYMNVLNTTPGLNHQLKKALSMPEVVSTWSEQEIAVAQILMKDFAKSGIDLPDKERQQFVDLSNDISRAGTEFTSHMALEHDSVALNRNQLNGVDPTVAGKCTKWNKAIVPLYGPEARVVMSTSHDEAARRDLYIADRTASHKSVRRLEQLLRKRAELASLTGYSSFAQMTLTDKMAKTPEAANNFLRSLNTSNKVSFRQDIRRIEEFKNSLASSGPVQPWDYTYYQLRQEHSRKLSSLRTSKSRLHDTLPYFLSLGTVISGLSRLFSRLYGVRLVPRTPLQGEAWSNDVRVLDVVSETEGHIAIIYCDLFSRPGKRPNPAHFTLVCSREISAEEHREAVSNPDTPLNDGMPLAVAQNPLTGTQTLHQVPTIALVCDFAPPSANNPTLLSLSSLTTLFHEMGHAVHSILGRTPLQTISGTRVATDFAELPSVLMEYFAIDPAVLSLYARHWQSDAPIPTELIDSLKKEQNEKSMRSAGYDSENQILMAMLDQALHSEEALQAVQNEGRVNSTQIYHHIWNTYGSLWEPSGTAWQGLFGHLYGYGATYYAYLFDRAIARQVWRAVFDDGEHGGGIERSHGERFKEEVLKWGGGRDPWICLENLMGNGQGVLAEGRERAMQEVGKWGIDAGADTM